MIDNILFFDFEFTGLHQKTTPISLGIVSLDGKTFYAEFDDFDISAYQDKWIKKNVLDNLWIQNPEINCQFNCDKYSCGNKKDVTRDLMEFLSQFEGKNEIWGDCCQYDWVLFCELFNGAFNIPKNINYIPFDIATLFKIKNINPDINREEFVGIKEKNKNSFAKHNALFDAVIIKKCYKKLISL
jgi:hypothetical protein